MGVRISHTKVLTIPRRRRILKSLGMTEAQYRAWTNWSLTKDHEANPGWTEREWADLLLENLDVIKGGVA